MTTDRPAPACDPRALRVARAVQQATGIAQVFLFGSRARGDYAPESDTDLLLVHAEDPAVRATAQLTAAQTIQKWYEGPGSADIRLVSPALFASVQFGRNHIAAQVAKEGVTPAGQRYHPPRAAAPPQDPLRLEAMERAFHAGWKLETLESFMWVGAVDWYSAPERFDMAVGDAAQGALELALKALLAALGDDYGTYLHLDRLVRHVRQVLPEVAGLESSLESLSDLAAGHIHGFPTSEQGIEDLCTRVRSDVRQVFDLVQRQEVAFDPWTVRKADFSF